MAVKDLTETIDPLRQREGRPLTYYDQLRKLELKHGKETNKAFGEEEAPAGSEFNAGKWSSLGR